jgi:DNA-binding MarR family transcriptional regulator
MEPKELVQDEDYRALAEFRYQLRRFLRFSEQAARAAGLEPQQHQLLMVIKGLPLDRKPTIGVIAERMQLEHHSTVELIDRLEERGLVRRYRDKLDRRQVLVRVTPAAAEILAELSAQHLRHLGSVGPAFIRVLRKVITEASGSIQRLTAENER